MKQKQVPSGPPAGGWPPRWFLYATATLAGAAIMIVEILGAKMLSPFVGTSHFVWTAQIGITLMALATGYYWGGRLADRSPQPGRLYACIGSAAVYLCLTVLGCEPVAYACLRFRLALGSALASFSLFFVPLTLLATTGPFLARLLTQSMKDVGGQVGRLSAVSTVGSVLGTGLIGYVLVPLFPNSLTMFATAMALFGLVGAYFIFWGGKSSLRSVILVVMGTGLLAGAKGLDKEANAHVPNFTELDRGNSPFGRLQVVRSEDDGRLLYLNDFLVQNTYDPAAKKSTSMFTYLLHGLARAYCSPIQRVLCIGMGMGIVPREFAREGAHVEVVEINPAILPLAIRYFDLDPRRFRLTFGDGRYFINQATQAYDVIVLDAFLGDSSPSHLMTLEAFRGMQKILRPGGVLVMNSFGELEPGRDFLCASLEKTLGSVFKSVRIHAASNGNVFFAASDQPELAFLQPPRIDTVHPYCRSLAREAFDTVVHYSPEHGLVLTDNYNPVEFFDSANRECLRRDLALSMRGSNP